MTAIAIVLCVCSGVLGWLTATARRRSEIERLTIQRNVARIALDEAERDFRRMTDPDRLQWRDARTDAGIDRLIVDLRDGGAS